jgi:hypothetical protein
MGGVGVVAPAAREAAPGYGGTPQPAQRGGEAVSRAAHGERQWPKQRGAPVTHQRTRCNRGRTKSGGKDPLNTRAARERSGWPGRGIVLASPRRNKAEHAHALQGEARQQAAAAATWLELCAFVSVLLSMRHWHDTLGQGGSTHAAAAHAGGLCVR